MGVMDPIYTCPRCGIAGRWVDLIVRGDISEESGWRSPTLLFHSCEQRQESWWRSLRNWFQRKPARKGEIKPGWSGKVEVHEFSRMGPNGVETYSTEMVLMTVVL